VKVVAGIGFSVVGGLHLFFDVVPLSPEVVYAGGQSVDLVTLSGLALRDGAFVFEVPEDLLALGHGG